jgi:hypothetical protein
LQFRCIVEIPLILEHCFPTLVGASSHWNTLSLTATNETEAGREYMEHLRQYSFCHPYASAQTFEATANKCTQQLESIFVSPKTMADNGNAFANCEATLRSLLTLFRDLVQAEQHELALPWKTTGHHQLFCLLIRLTRKFSYFQASHYTPVNIVIITNYLLPTHN